MLAGGLLSLSAIMLSALPLPRGDFGTYWTVMVMRSKVIQEFMLPIVRMNAVRIASQAGARDGTAQAVAIRQWIEDHSQFMRDPDGVEMLHGPAWQMREALRQGMVYVDCDDIAMLAAALGKAVGLQARFVVVGFGTPNAPYRHVWTELSSPDSGVWVECDITRPSQGLPFDNISRTYVSRV